MTNRTRPISESWRGSPSMRADQSDGPDVRLHARPCQDGPDDMLDAQAIVHARFPLSSN
jgi:hypothetical protein